MSSRSAAFCIDSGQLRFAMIRNLTVILRDLNLGAWRPCQIDKTSLSRGRVVTFALSQTDSVWGGGAFNSAGNSSRVYDTWNPKTSPTVCSLIWDLYLANNDYKISSLQSVVWISSSVQVRYFLSYFNNSSFQSYPKIYFSSSRSLFVSKNHVYFGSCGDRVYLAFEESLLITMLSKVARKEEDFPPKKKRKSFGCSEEWKIW